MFDLQRRIIHHGLRVIEILEDVDVSFQTYLYNYIRNAHFYRLNIDISPSEPCILSNKIHVVRENF